MDREPKSISALKATQRVIQQNINRIYRICDALYEEIHTIKHFVGYKPPPLEGGRQQQSSRQNPMESLETMPGFGDDSAPTHRKLKIIDN